MLKRETMESGKQRMSGCRNGNARARVVAVAFLVCATLPASACPAGAFELFGVRLWGSPKEDADIADPLRYAATLTLTEGDGELRNTLEKASELMSGQERPVSGSLGLLSRHGPTANN